MEKSKVKIHVTTPSGKKIKRTITNHTSIEDLNEQLNVFIKETSEAIESAKKITVTCSSCCNGLKYKNCFKTKIKTGDNELNV